MYFRLLRSEILSCSFSGDTVCVCMFVCSFMRESHYVQAEYFSKPLQCSRHIIYKALCLVFSFILKFPFIDFMTHLRGMPYNLKDTVLKDIEQNSIQYWSLYIMEKWFINFFFYFLLSQYFNLDINVLKLFQKHIISSEFETVSSKTMVIVNWFIILMVFKHLLMQHKNHFSFSLTDWLFGLLTTFYTFPSWSPGKF